MQELLKKCENWLDSGSFEKVVEEVDRFLRVQKSLPLDQREDDSAVAELELRKAFALVHMARAAAEKKDASAETIAGWQQEALKILSARSSLFSGDPFWEQMLAETARDCGSLEEALAACRQLQVLEPGEEKWTGWASECVQKLSFPASGNTFRVRVKQMWDSFAKVQHSIEVDLEDVVPGFGSRSLPALARSAVPEVKNTLKRAGSRCILTFQPEGDPAQGLLCGEAVRCAPAAQRKTWDFTAEGKYPGTTLSAPGRTPTDLRKVRVSAERTSMGTLILTVYDPACVNDNPWREGAKILREDEETARKWMEYCLRQGLGSLFCLRYVRECRPTADPPEDSVPLTQFPARLAQMGIPAPMDLEQFAGVLQEYEMTGDPEKMTWRTGVTRGWTSVPELLEQLCDGRSQSAATMRRHGAAAGSICIPLASLPAQGEPAEALLGDLAEQLTACLAEEVWHYAGYGIGETELYLDFLAWDLPAFLTAVKLSFRVTGITGICFRSMFAWAAPVPMEEWPERKLAGRMKRNITPLKPVTSVPPGTLRRPGYPLTSRPAPEQPAAGKKKEDRAAGDSRGKTGGGETEQRERPDGKRQERTARILSQLESEVFSLDCGNFRDRADGCIQLLRAGEYDTTVQTASSVPLGPKDKGTGQEFVFRMVEAAACYLKGIDAAEDRGRLDAASVPWLRRAAARVQEFGGGRSPVMNEIRDTCYELLEDTLFRVLNLENEPMAAREKKALLTAAGQRAALPLFTATFSRRAADTWKAFEAREKDFRQMLDRVPGGAETITSQVMDVFDIIFSCPKLKVRRISRSKYEVRFLLNGVCSMGLAIPELIRRAPKSLLSRWVFAVGDSETRPEVRLRGELLTPKDVKVYAEKYGLDWYLTCSVPKWVVSEGGTSRYRFSREEVTGAVQELLDRILGELWMARYGYSLQLTEDADMNSDLSMAGLTLRMRRQGSAVPMTVKDYLALNEMHCQPGDGTQPGVWRSGTVYSRTCCLYLLEDIYDRYPPEQVAYLNYAGAVAGSIALPRTDRHPLEMGDGFSDELERRCRKRMGPDIWMYLGWGCSSDTMWLDFLAWDLPAFLDGVSICLGTKLTDKATFHTWIGDSPAIPLRNWRKWQFPAWQRGFPLPPDTWEDRFI